MAEVLRTQTGGSVDLSGSESVRLIAAARLEIADGVNPSFADCGLSLRPDAPKAP